MGIMGRESAGAAGPLQAARQIISAERDADMIDFLCIAVFLTWCDWDKCIVAHMDAEKKGEFCRWGRNYSLVEFCLSSLLLISALYCLFFHVYRYSFFRYNDTVKIGKVVAGWPLNSNRIEKDIYAGCV